MENTQAAPTSPRQPNIQHPKPLNAKLSPPQLQSDLNSPGPYSHHRHSLSTDLRAPPSPRQHRHTSLSQQVLSEILSQPPVSQKRDEIFAGRDWKKIQVGEIVAPEDTHFVEVDTSVEDAANALIAEGPPNVVLVRAHKSTRKVTTTFDYSDLNAYLLMVVGLARPEEKHLTSFKELMRQAREGKPTPVIEVKQVGRPAEDFIVLPHTAELSKAVEIFGSGLHRILIAKEGTSEVGGVLSQSRLVRFFWEHGRHFPAIDSLYPLNLLDLQIGSRAIVSINGDRPLSEALQMMMNLSITSLPVLDNQRNVVGNISHTDVKLLTKSTSVPLLQSSCIHFISVILSERGMNDGKDSFPVFYVSPYSSLAHTVAKLSATRSHRMWLVDEHSPGPATPQLSAASSIPPSPVQAGQAAAPTNGPPYTPTSGAAVPASSLPGQHMSGRLSGVVSLTDVLNLFARASGLSPQDPDDARRRRRRGSSSSSMRVSLDSARSSSVDLSRSGSVGGSRR